jgi:hypothetical protein
MLHAQRPAAAFGGRCAAVDGRRAGVIRLSSGFCSVAENNRRRELRMDDYQEELLERRAAEEGALEPGDDASEM